MFWQLLPSLSLFTFVVAITPGPNNFLLANSGAQFGIRKTMGHIVGIRLGICGLILCSAIGIGVLIHSTPIAYRTLKYLGVAYMSYLALKLIASGGQLKQSKSAKPFTWYNAALFQLANVKAWAASISLVASYAIAGSYWLSIAWIILIFTITGFIANTSWAYLGRTASLLLNTPTKVRTFNYTLSAITFVTILPILFQSSSN